MPTAARSILTIGNFDGVHAGHQALLATARSLAQTHNARVVALAFDPHPISVLRPQATPPRLSTFEQRSELLLQHGADQVERLEPTPQRLALTPDQFIHSLVEQYAPVAFVEGPDFHFGKARAGTVTTLEQLGQSLGFSVQVVQPVSTVTSDQLIITASSSNARTLIAQGRILDAWAVLGRPYELRGSVQQGDQRGRTIGFPTANIRCDTMLPADGVYAALASIDDGRTWPAAVNIGSRPTFDGIDRRVEAHLINATGSAWTPIAGLPEYGWNLRLQLVGWIRDQAKYPGMDALIQQINRDRARATCVVTRRMQEVA